MNSKERVRAAINLEQPDRVPLGFYAVDYDTIEHVLGRKTLVRNKVEWRIALWEGRRDELAEMAKRDVVEFYRKIDCADLICFKEAPIMPSKGYDPDPPRKIGDGLWQDREGRVYKVSELTNDMTCVEDPTIWAREYTVEEFEKPAADAPPDPSVFEVVDHLIAELGEDRYIAGSSGGTAAPVLLGGWERGFLAYVEMPEVVRAATRHAVQAANLRDRHYIRPGVAGVLMEHDMASSKGPMMSPRMFREFAFEALKERVQRVRGLGMQVSLHNCGNNWLLMDMLVEAGIQCYQSLQSIPDMELGRLKAAYGDRMAFWGGIPVEHLVLGTPEDIRRDVREALEKGAPGGGFILGPSHSIAKGTKYENFMALLDEYDRLKDKF